MAINRRKLVGLTGGLVVSLTGCLGRDLESCPELGELFVHLPATVPDEETVHEAEDGLLEIAEIERALQQARGEYEPGMEAELEGESRRLTIVSSESMASDGEVEEAIGYDERTYVEYEDVVYELSYVESVC